MNWPVRVRHADETEWHAGQVINLSVTGILLETDRTCHIGERVEVEIDFLTQPMGATVVAGVGLVVRTDNHTPGRAAVRFAVECGLSTRRDAAAADTRRPA
jgi:hypothetical protein